jgi:hypothetical protein
MCRCKVCGPVTTNEAAFVVYHGKADVALKVCGFCVEDLKLLGARVNQVVGLPKPAFRKAAYWFLGPVRSLFREA